MQQPPKIQTTMTKATQDDLLRKQQRKQGVTLVELMIAMMIFSFVAITMTRALLQARRLAEYNVHLITVNTVIEGYLEQMKSMSLDQLTSDEIPTIRLAANSGKTYDTTEDALYNGVTTEVRSIDVNGTPDNPSDDIRLFVQPIITDHRKDSPPHVNILLNYHWIVHGPNGSRQHRGSIRYIRSAIRNT